ncbi:MAG: hypothetical protein ABIH90_02200 [Candidatus Aenigmatarchaeota archaeon]
MAHVMRGVLSENLIEVFGIIISVFLIFLIGISLFTSQSERGGEVGYSSMAREIATIIDRVAAEAGSAKIEMTLTRGLPADVTVGNHEVVLSWEGKKKAGAAFSAPTGLDEQTVKSASSLCIVKSRSDKRIIVQDGDCKCMVGDQKCDASCVVDGICDPACVKNETDYICLPACVEGGDGVCDQDCVSPIADWVWDKDCAKTDGICDPDSNRIQDKVCDIDCLKNQTDGHCDPECTKERDSNGDGMEDSRDGICDLDCIHEKITRTQEGFVFDSSAIKDGICDLDCADRGDVCDPDCPDFMEQCNPCASTGETADGKPCCSGLTPCASSNVCSVTCCGNGVCEEKGQWPLDYHPKNWENPCTCQQDCAGNCPRPGADCETGNFTSGICYMNLMGEFYSGKIEVCSDAVRDFLDRRMWDINEVADTTLSTGPPMGWGFDDSRYSGDVCSKLQFATTTIVANEGYNQTDRIACCESMQRQQGASCDEATLIDESACGLGFCADHSTALYSIMRRLGVPAKDLWVTYTLSGDTCRPHAFVVHRCNTSLESRLVLDECAGRDGQWIALDATGHFIAPMSGLGCRTMCLWWNENGFYFEQEGKINDQEGWAYSQSAKCSATTWEGGETCTDNAGTAFPCQFNDYCSKNNLPCTDFCTNRGIKCKW